MTTASRTQRTGTERSAKQKRIASREAKAFHAAQLQAVREGTPTMLRSILADHEAKGNILASPPDTEVEGEDLCENEALDADLSLEDEDSPVPDDSEIFRDPLLYPDRHEEFGEAALSEEEVFSLLVSGTTCSLQKPAWMRGRARNDAGQEIVDEIGGRLDSLEKIGSWLSKERSQFLSEADPWYLGCDALQELKAGLLPVVEGGLTKLAGIQSGQFTRHKRHCHLVWEEGSLPLDFLVSPQAKKAWVANAVVQRNNELGEQFDEEKLSSFTDIAKPRDAKTKNALLSRPITSLSFSEFIQRVTLASGTSWNEVIADYNKQLIDL